MNPAITRERTRPRAISASAGACGRTPNVQRDACAPITLTHG